MKADENPKQRVMPTLRITDYSRSKEFYVERLGFRVDWEHRFKPGFPVFMQVSRDELALFLTEHAGDCPVGGLVHLYVPDVDAWFSEFQQRGVPVREPPNEDLQGLRCMTVVDPDGNKVRILTRLKAWTRSSAQHDARTIDHKPADRRFKAIPAVQCVPSVHGLIPVLPVADVDASLAFYRDRLGFSVEGRHADERGTIVFGSVLCGGANFYFRRTTPPIAPNHAMVFVNEVDEICELLTARGIRIVEPPENKPWGYRQFTLEDPDRHRLTVFQFIDNDA